MKIFLDKLEDLLLKIIVIEIWSILLLSIGIIFGIILIGW